MMTAETLAQFAPKARPEYLKVLGEEGNAVTDLSPSGKVFVHGEWWDALSEVPVLQGERVVVIKKEGMLLRVEPKK